MATVWHLIFFTVALVIQGNNGAPAIANVSQAIVPNVPMESNSTVIKTPAVKEMESPTIFLMTSLEVAESDFEKKMDLASNKMKKNPMKLTKIGNSLRRFTSMFSMLGGFLSMLAVVTTTTDLQVISDMFGEVNKKLDAINDRLVKLDNSVELHNLLSNYIPWEYSITNGIHKLVETYTSMAKESNMHQRRAIAGNFINFFENNQIESNINNLIYMTTTSSAVLQKKKLFDELIDKAGCNFGRLTGIYTHMKQIFTQGSQLILAYYTFKDGKFPLVQTYIDALTSIRNSYDYRIWHCKETTITRSKSDVDKLVKRNSNEGRGATVTVKNVNKALSKKYPWYSWSIINNKRWVGSKRNATTGNQYYEMLKVGKFGMNIVVAWQGVDEKAECYDIDRSKTFLFIGICRGCQNSHVSINEDMLSKNKCPKNRYPRVKAFIDRQGPELDRNSEEYDAFWLAAGFSSETNPCSHRCNNRGECKVVPYTNQFQCFCRNNYEGEKCESKIEIKNDIQKMLSDLQNGYKSAFKVSSLANILTQAENLAKQLKKMIQRMDTHFELTHILVKYIRDLQKLDYILKLSFNYSKRKISIDSYNRRMKKFLALNPIHFIFQQLSNAILAEGFTDAKGQDFFNTFKKMIASNRGACSAEYGNEAQVLFERLSELDITAAEAILAHYEFESNYLNSENMDSMMESAKQLVMDSKRRMRSYAKYWERTSCPPLNVSYLVQNGCGYLLSFEGMKVNLACEDGRQATPQRIECVKVGGKLQWSAEAECKSSWSEWSEWSSCPEMCDSSTTTRSRVCNGSPGETCVGQASQEKKCFSEDCCQAKYGKFRCDAKTCLDVSEICNGVEQCSDGSDESKCDYLRSGDRIALRNMRYSQDWLSVQYTDAVQADLHYGRAYLDDCIQDDDVTDDEWNYCAGQSLRIYGNYQNGKTGKAIRYGDRVALYYRKTNYHYRWFICYPTYCMTYTCDKRYGEFDFNPRGECKEYQFYLADYNNRESRAPVKPGDIITISNGRGSVKGNGHSKTINQDDCTVRRSQDNRIDCKANAWQIYVK